MTHRHLLTGLTKTNLREQALASLRTAITSGQIPPESQMVETELSDSSASAAAPSAKPCGSCSRKACWSPVARTPLRPTARTQGDR